GRHGDDRFGHRLTEIVLGGLLHFHEHARRDLRRRHLLALHLDPGVTVVRARDLVGDHLDVPPYHLVLELAADEALDGEQGVLGIGHRLALGGLAHHHLAVLGKGDDRGGGAITLAVLDHPGLAALHDGHARVGRAEVDTDYLCHGFTPAGKSSVKRGMPGPLLRGGRGRFQARAGSLATITRAGPSGRAFGWYSGFTTARHG